MSLRRLLVTTAVMAAVAALFGALAPSPPEILSALAAPQELADTTGPGALVLAVAGALAWLAWAWGALGLLLTAAGALPGAAGGAARWLQRVLLPAGARQAAAVVLGVGVALQVPLSTAALAATSSVAVVAGPAVPDWPTDEPDAAGPAAPAVPAAQHVVVRGDCLWDIATDHLRTTSGQPPSAAAIASAVPAWWSANRAVIGDDPDLLLPGQVLTPPAMP